MPPKPKKFLKTPEGQRSIWPMLNDPKAAVIAAVIGAIGLVVGAVIGFGGTYLTLTKTPQNQIIVKEAEQNIQDKSKQNEQILKSFDEAFRAIQGMKESISQVLSDPIMKYGDAGKRLEKPSKNLIVAYGGNVETGSRAYGVDICGVVSNECAFHKAKETGRQALTYVQAQPESTQLSEEAIKSLNKFRSQLDEQQKEITMARASFKGDRIR